MLPQSKTSDVVLLVSSAASGIESFLAKSWGDNPCSSVKDTEELEYVWDSLVDVMYQGQWPKGLELLEYEGGVSLTGIPNLTGWRKSMDKGMLESKEGIVVCEGLEGLPDVEWTMNVMYSDENDDDERSDKTLLFLECE